MPLRSVEAATRDDAIAAAREQFGPHARVVGVRRVRSGGVLGFFATERYVAEVADSFPGPGSPAPSAAAPAAAPVASYDSPLASAAPARAAAPSRNGAAAWAAEAARSGGAPAARPHPSTGSRPVVQPPVPAPSDDDRLEELVRLLGSAPSAPHPAPAALPRHAASAPSRAVAHPPTGPVPAAFRRASSAKAIRTSAAAPARSDAEPVSTAAAPSPFTAALARMVAGDRDVRQAVAEALEQPADRFPEEPAPRLRERHGPDAEPTPPAARPSLAAAIRSADPSMRSTAVHQEETTVGEQVVTPPSPSTAAPAGAPTGAARQEPPAPAAPSRQEEIAEALRSALAQGHSDEALAGLLRKVLAGDDPQQALVEPLVVEPAATALPAAPAGSVPADGPAGGPDAAPLVVEVAAGREPGSSGFALFGPGTTPPAAADLRWDASPMGTSSLWGTPVPTEEVAPAPAPAPAADMPLVVAAEEAPIGKAPIEKAPVEKAPVEVAPIEVAPVADRLFQGDLFGGDLSGGDLSGGDLFGGDLFGGDLSGGDLFGGDLFGGDLFGGDLFGGDLFADAAVPGGPVAGPAPAPAPPRPVDQAATPLEPAVEDVAAAAEPVAAEPVAAEVGTAAAESEPAPLLARTASDPAPTTMSLDATTVLPRVSLLPAHSGSRGRGLPPVPPPSGRPAVPSARRTPAADAPAPAPAEPTGAPEPGRAEDAQEAVAAAAEPGASAAPVRSPRALATVTRLPVAPLMAGSDLPDAPEGDDEPSMWATSRTAARSPEDVVAELVALGVPRDLLGPAFAGAVAGSGTYAALTSALAAALPALPEVPVGAGEVLFVVGPGVEALRAARSLAVSLRLDPDRVQWATPGDLAGLAPKASRMTTVDAAIDRRQESSGAGTLTIVAVDAPLRGDAYWMTQMLSVWSPAAVWAVVEATRKPEDLEPWLGGLPRVDALAVQDTDLSADPAAVLHRLTMPVVLLDGARATPHRWASLLCERLDAPPA